MIIGGRNKRQKKPKEQSRMIYPETRATFDTRHRTKYKQNKETQNRKLKIVSNMDTTKYKNWG